MRVFTNPSYTKTQQKKRGRAQEPRAEKFVITRQNFGSLDGKTG